MDRRLGLAALLASTLALALAAVFATTVSPLTGFYATGEVSAPYKPVKVSVLETPILQIAPGACGPQSLEVGEWLRIEPAAGVDVARLVLSIANLDMLAGRLRALHIEVFNTVNNELLATMSLQDPSAAIVLDAGSWAENGTTRYAVLAARIYYEPRDCNTSATVAVPLLVTVADQETGTIYLGPASYNQTYTYTYTTTTTQPNGTATVTVTTTVTVTAPPVNTTTTSTATKTSTTTSTTTTSTQQCPEAWILYGRTHVHVRIYPDCSETSCGPSGCIVAANYTLYVILDRDCGCLDGRDTPIDLEIELEGVQPHHAVCGIQVRLYDANHNMVGELTPSDPEAEITIDEGDCVAIQLGGHSYPAVPLTAEIRIDTCTTSLPYRFKVILDYSTDPGYCRP
ncbi:hypothetical protein [Pyrodictium abyssi]|uniref:Uncharacterized protein n=1 Tax=Pyrodictium abyssi TaxID=54256 RepID=A0ABM8IY84_9CREN|nr:hypothetical protein PABY_06900 [Pyrodictium abyssi]